MDITHTVVSTWNYKHSAKKKLTAFRIGEIEK